MRSDRDSRLCKVTDIWHLLHLVERRAATGYLVVCSYLLAFLHLRGLSALFVVVACTVCRERVVFFIVKRGIHY